MNVLLVIDIQNDFLPGGALAVPEGDVVVPIANRMMRCFGHVVATQDWHPADHGSFAVNHSGKKPGEFIDLNGLSQILWPAHCVQNTGGAAFGPGLETARVARIIQKGTDPGIDSYSGFFDNGHLKATGLWEYLKQRGAVTLYILGLATDYCVKFTALDARQLGYETYLIEDACRGVNIQPEDSQLAVAEMEKAGVKRITSAEIESKERARLHLEMRKLPDPRTIGNAYRKTAPVWAVLMDRDFEVPTLEGIIHGKAGDYLCEGPAGERWPVRRDIFEATYQPTDAKEPK